MSKELEEEVEGEGGEGKDNQAIVVDMGSGNTRVGFANNKIPVHVIPTIVGHPKTSSEKDCIFPNMFHTFHNNLEMSYPMKRGRVENWEDMEKFIRHCIEMLDLNKDCEGESILFTEPTLNPKDNRENITRHVFEEFKFGGFYIGIDGVMGLYGSGRTTGLVLTSGHGVTSIIPIYEGYALPHAIERLDLGGIDITDYFVKLIEDKYRLDINEIVQVLPNDNTFLQGREYVSHRLKEMMAYISLDIESERLKLKKKVEFIRKECKLPDGNVIELTSERFESTEMLFSPSTKPKQDVNLEDVTRGRHPTQGNFHNGITNHLLESLRKCDRDIRLDMVSNIILCGGNTMIRGFPGRLREETRRGLIQFSKNENDNIDNNYKFLSGKVNVHADQGRDGTVWKGASILAGLSTFGNMWISKSEYDEAGPLIVHRKCF